MPLPMSALLTIELGRLFAFTFIVATDQAVALLARLNRRQNRVPDAVGPEHFVNASRAVPAVDVGAQGATAAPNPRDVRAVEDVAALGEAGVLHAQVGVAKDGDVVELARPLDLGAQRPEEALGVLANAQQLALFVVYLDVISCD